MERRGRVVGGGEGGLWGRRGRVVGKEGGWWGEERDGGGEERWFTCILARTHTHNTEGGRKDTITHTQLII